MKSNYTPAAGSLLRQGAEQFSRLRQDSSDVEKLFDSSVRLETRIVPKLKKFIRTSVLALRAARKLLHFPSEEVLKEYLHQLVDQCFSEVINELNESESSNTQSPAKGTAKK